MAKYKHPHAIALAIVADRMEHDPEKLVPIKALRDSADEIERLSQLVEKLEARNG